MRESICSKKNHRYKRGLESIGEIMGILKYKKAICYSGYRKGQNPKGQIPTKEQIAEDLAILAKDGYGYIRMYDPNDHARRALQVIRENNYPIKAIVGIDSDPEINNPGCPFEDQHYSDEELAANAKRNDNEREKLIALANEYKEEIAALSIGNENTPPWGAHTVSVERLIDHADKLKEATGLPITYCEGSHEWPNLLELAKHLDFISVHSYPWHENLPVDGAVDVNATHYDNVKRIFPDKQVIFTEMGWTTCSDGNVNDAQATLPNQKKYIRELTAWLDEKQIIGFIFEAFDELWKSSGPEKSECNWGLYTEERTKKW